MEMKKAAEYVRDNWRQTKNRFKITSSDGTWRLANLGVMPNGTLVEYPKNTRRYGAPVPEGAVSDWYALERVYNKSDAVQTTRRNLTKIYNMLSGSGLWPTLRDHAEDILKLPLPTFDRVVEAAQEGACAYDQTVAAACSRKGGFTYGEMASLSMPDTIRNISYLPEDRAEQRSRLRAALGSQASYASAWHNRRDNKVSCGRERQEMRGWYTEERSDGTDRRVYMMLDEAHAMPFEEGAR